MSYLAPPPMPAPVVVTKDVGGFVSDYQTQTALYRITGREVRLHECRSACTMALSLPNVCVYPNSVLKFHLAYDPRDHQPNAQVSQQLFGSYPAAVRARLGTLTREYKVLRGSELIELGIRDCNEPKTNAPKIMVASAPARKSTPAAGPEKPLVASLMDKMLSIFGADEGVRTAREHPAVLAPPAPTPAPGPALLTEIPLPPVRPPAFAQPARAAALQPERPAPVRPAAEPAPDPPPERALVEAARAADVPPPRQADAARPAGKFALALPKIIAGAQPILPPGFTAYADLDPRS